MHIYRVTIPRYYTVFKHTVFIYRVYIPEFLHKVEHQHGLVMHAELRAHVNEGVEGVDGGQPACGSEGGRYECMDAWLYGSIVHLCLV